LAGVYIYKFNGETVKKGDTLFRIYSDNKTRLHYAVEHLEKNTGCYVIE
jgi:thymidine phosphorylase